MTRNGGVLYVGPAHLRAQREAVEGSVITFNVNPEIHKIEGKTLQEKVSFMQRMQWDGLRSVLVRRAGAPRSSVVVVVNHCT
jgi:hypothetical protein